MTTFGERIGPCYSVEGVAQLLGRSEQEVRDAIASSELLAIKTSDGVTILPVAQFGDDSTPLPSLALVAAEYGQTDPLALALALLTPSPVFNGHTGVVWLRAGRTEDVLEAVRRAARALQD